MLLMLACQWKDGWLVADRKAELAHRLPGLKQTVFLI